MVWTKTIGIGVSIDKKKGRASIFVSVTEWYGMNAIINKKTYTASSMAHVVIIAKGIYSTGMGSIQFLEVY